jgi:AhpD family alkylhydroperoxidase
MIEFPLYEADTAPEASRADLEALTRSFGFLPNHPKILAESPAALRAYRALNEILSESTFTAIERNALLIAISVEHRCDYCVSAHTTLLRMAQGSDQVIRGLRTRKSTGDARVDALARFARTMVEKRVRGAPGLAGGAHPLRRGRGRQHRRAHGRGRDRGHAGVGRAGRA